MYYLPSQCLSPYPISPKHEPLLTPWYCTHCPLELLHLLLEALEFWERLRAITLCSNHFVVFPHSALSPGEWILVAMNKPFLDSVSGDAQKV